MSHHRVVGHQFLPEVDSNTHYFYKIVASSNQIKKLSKKAQFNAVIDCCSSNHLEKLLEKSC